MQPVRPERLIDQKLALRPLVLPHATRPRSCRLRSDGLGQPSGETTSYRAGRQHPKRPDRPAQAQPNRTGLDNRTHAGPFDRDRDQVVKSLIGRDHAAESEEHRRGPARRKSTSSSFLGRRASVNRPIHGVIRRSEPVAFTLPELREQGRRESLPADSLGWSARLPDPSRGHDRKMTSGERLAVGSLGGELVACSP